ncbi:hypothetical protein P153DRAFT_161749 [Dothidotthia symphoricarpi CBS 119687]|uniref:Uncharacterized protein n=1 Tax=Dothidotthia symphoricarpi CBS 119687 TaxID=1392245 RepID=A0A6A5ZV63_9PLEO|nr:uncharacterized protein P153DRAFT_161749 [Dothidotthia symphoricarpi CBS 119687]KAF2123530.1 hypothetical protein P153DRAFT_161749 [Dothidotthia symphoricarpi CBS 119687]
MLRELMETWYNMSYIDEDLIARVDLRDYFSRDKWGLGIRPFDHLRSICIVIKEEDFHLQSVSDNFTSLLEVKHNAELNVVVKPLFRHNEPPYTMGSCGRQTCRQAMMIFFCKKKNDIASFFRNMRPLYFVLRQLKVANWSVQVHFSISFGPTVLLYGCDSCTEFSLDAWLLLVLNKKREYIEQGKLCRCRTDGPERKGEHGSLDVDEDED